jgi:N-acetylneuraminic acid mutarotase
MKLTILRISFIVVVLLIQACSPTEEKLWISGWQEASAMNVARAGSAMVAHNKFIYMIAGVDGRQFLRSTEYAPILPNGQLGQWRMGSALVIDRGFTEAVVRNGYIYVVGGGNGPNGEHLLQSVERARINDDGSLGQWQLESSQTILPRRCTKLALTGDTLYSFGGYGGALLDSVEYAKISDDGSVGSWKIASKPMLLPRYVNSVKAVDGNTYVIGGHDQNKGVGIADVEWAKPQTDGDIQSWVKTNSLKTGRYGLASAKNGNTLYALGGLTGLEYLDSIEKSSVLPSGELSSWQETTAMTTARAMFSALAHNNYFYVLGGTNRNGYLRSVEVATINSEGNPGFWGNANDKDVYQSRLQAQKNNGPVLSNEGVIKQVLHTEAYSYLHVLNQGKMVWLAGPKTQLPINTRIRYSEGVYMTNFFSKELQRPFPAVTFVGRIEEVR